MQKDFLLEKLGYTVVFIGMLLLFALYPLWIEEMLYNNLISPNIQIKPPVKYEIMRYIPLVYISLIGLLFSWINTLIYCYVDNEKRNLIYAFIYTLIAVWIAVIITSSYYEFSDIFITDEANEKDIQRFFSLLSDRVTRLTFVTFFFYFFIDLKDVWYLKNYRSTSATDYKNQKGRIDFKYSLYQFAIIDLPVIIGSLLIILYVTKIDKTLFAFDEDEGDTFLNIFSSGAWGMQLIYSQVVFYILTISYYIDLKRIKKDPNQLDTTHG